jgi:hypothetical protein
VTMEQKQISPYGAHDAPHRRVGECLRTQRNAATGRQKAIYSQLRLEEISRWESFH